MTRAEMEREIRENLAAWNRHDAAATVHRSPVYFDSAALAGGAGSEQQAAGSAVS